MSVEGGLILVSRSDERVRRQKRRRRRVSVERTGQELLLLMGLILVCSAGALAQSGGGKPSAVTPIAATVTVVAPSRALPKGMADREIRVEQLEPLEFRELVGRVADRLGMEAVVEDRPGRVAGGSMVLDPPVPFGLAMAGKVPAVLDELARLSGYDWAWSGGRLVFFRYADGEQRQAVRLPRGVSVDVLAALVEREAAVQAAQVDGALELEGRGEALSVEGGETPDAKVDEAGRLAAGVPGEVEPGLDGRLGAEVVAAVEGPSAPASADPVEVEPAGWEVDPERHDTVEGVLRAWAERAGWNLAWDTDRQFRVGAAALFGSEEDEQESFLKAADALLAIAPMRRTLTATAYPNRWLVIRDVGSAVR